MDLIGLVILLIVLILVVYLAQLLIGMLHLPPPVSTALYILIAIVVILWLLGRFGLASWRV